jgi:hypothetical protein
VFVPLLGIACSSHSYTELDDCPHPGAMSYPRAETGEPCYLASAAPAGSCEKWTKCTTCIVGAVCSDGASAGDYPNYQCSCGGSGTWSCNPGDPDASGCGNILTDAGRPDALAPEASGGNPDTGADDGGGPDTASDGAAPSCPATYADVPQFSPCSADVSCNYYGQFSCACVYGAESSREWECISFNCICSSGDAGCVNQACTTDADCPSGQHCSDHLGQGGNVCSVGCESDAGPGGPNASCPVGAMCESIAP